MPTSAIQLNKYTFIVCKAFSLSLSLSLPHTLTYPSGAYMKSEIEMFFLFSVLSVLLVDLLFMVTAKKKKFKKFFENKMKNVNRN